MTQQTIPPAVLRFLREEIDTVPHLEGLLLVWESAPRPWRLDELASRLYVNLDTGRRLVADLARRRLIHANGDSFTYNEANDYAALLPEVSREYRNHLVQVAHIIHAKGSTAMQEFSRAFKLKKDDR